MSLSAVNSTSDSSDPSSEHVKPTSSATKQPSSIAALAERVMSDLWDGTKDLKQILRLAKEHQKAGEELARRGDLEGAFVELAKAATLVIEKLPSHKDYHGLTSIQRHNLGLNGQDLLQRLGEIKPALDQRYEKWLQRHPDDAEQLNARTQGMSINGDLTSSPSMQDSVKLQGAAVGSTQAQTPTASERENQENRPRVAEQRKLARPPTTVPTPTTALKPESARYFSDSESSQTVYWAWARPGKQRLNRVQTPPVGSLRQYMPPITMPSPFPGVNPRHYTNLMSPHQTTQGYYPSPNSVFKTGCQTGIDSDSDAPQLVPPSPEAHSIAPHTPRGQEAGQNIPATSKAGSSSERRLKTVNLPSECLPRFLSIAKRNTDVNLETCGLLLGKDKGHKYHIMTLLIPKQHSTSDTCTMDEEELVLQFTEERNLLTLGWIHTHPSQSCFMTSRDLHKHAGFQRMLPESFAVVCAPNSTPKFGIFRLTDPHGLHTILDCPEKPDVSHSHLDVPIYTDADKGHVQLKDLSLEIVDLR